MPEKKPKISKDMPMADLFFHYPEAVGVMLSHGFQCVLCGQAMYESLEQGAFSHGFDHKAVRDLVKELKEAVAKAPAVPADSKPDELKIRQIPPEESKAPKESATELAFSQKYNGLEEAAPEKAMAPEGKKASKPAKKAPAGKKSRR